MEYDFDFLKRFDPSEPVEFGDHPWHGEVRTFELYKIALETSLLIPGTDIRLKRKSVGRSMYDPRRR